ncbi:prepilin-type N-terminal cleavage/methylation domain-containing protein, partial [Patescibacteria group bacterium]|nr:prepilin-type N-terminal cleavage/methylation domain-containing protein [Patescibacteria group bacterium]
MKKGFTLIETLIAIAILVIVIIGIVGVLQMNIRIANRTSSRVGAVSLINKRMEMLRNLDYDNIGTIGGIPSGDIPQQETIILNDIEYTLKTFIQYFDDLKDGIGENDEN